MNSSQKLESNEIDDKKLKNVAKKMFLECDIFVLKVERTLRQLHKLCFQISCTKDISPQDN